MMKWIPASSALNVKGYRSLSERYRVILVNFAPKVVLITLIAMPASYFRPAPIFLIIFQLLIIGSLSCVLCWRISKRRKLANFQNAMLDGFGSIGTLIWCMTWKNAKAASNGVLEKEALIFASINEGGNTCSHLKRRVSEKVRMKRSRHRTTVSRWSRSRTCLTKLVCPWSRITQEYRLLKGHKLTGNESHKAERRNLAVIEGRISFLFSEKEGNTCIIICVEIHVFFIKIISLTNTNIYLRLVDASTGNSKWTHEYKK